MEIAEFLLARYAEDEAVARAAQELAREDGRWWVDGPATISAKWWVYATGEKFEHRPIAEHIARFDPARVLAECEAKRRIVERWGSRGPIMYLLALPYAEHPDYREEWKV